MDAVVSTLCQGKMAEHLAVCELLRRGHKVALPVADDDGVDLVVDYRLRIQVKGTRGVVREVQPGQFYWTASWKASPRGWTNADFFFLHADGRWWIVPVDVMVGHGRSLRVYGNTKSGKSAEVAAYEDAWHLLRS